MSEVSKFYSIVTPALNCAAFLPRNVASVAGQGVPKNMFEHLIIDGGSNDGTVEFLKHQSGINFVSEKDRGLSHAVNKGIQKASGEWIIWLNADDELAPGALQYFCEWIKRNPCARMVTGDQIYFDYEGKVERRRHAKVYKFKDLLSDHPDIIQASTFVHRSVYEKIGLMNENFKFAMDYEWMVRASQYYKNECVPQVLSHYYRRKGSITDGGIYGQQKEFLLVRRMYNQSYFERAEWRCRFYIATEPLRKIHLLRKAVRKIKLFWDRDIPLNPI